MVCSVCEQDRPAEEFPAKGRRCRACLAAYHREWRARNRESSNGATRRWKARNRDKVRAAHRRRKYGLSEAAFAQMLADQDGLCAVCRRPLDDDVAVDHCHTTGTVRGLLHRNCNAALGQLGDDYRLVHLAALYLYRRDETNVHPWAIVGEPPEDRQHLGEPGIPPEVDPTAVLEAFATVDAGTVRATSVGPRTYMLKRSHVGHDAQVGADCDLATGSIVGGHAEIGDGCKVGLNAVILPYRKVGAGAIVGAGAVVTRDVPPGQVWAGNPARVIGLGKNPVPYTEREQVGHA